MAKSISSKPDFDEVDRRIIEVLRFQARLSNSALAKAVKLSESATLERVRRLERNGVIAGYSTRIAPEALGHNVAALVTIRLTSQSHDLYGDFLAEIDRMPEVLSCFQVMGGCDFVAHVAAQDVAHLEHFLSHVLLAHEAVARTESMFVLKVVKRELNPSEQVAIDA